MSSQTPGGSGNSEQRVPHRAEQEIIHQLGILQCNGRKFVRQGEHHVTVRYGQQVAGLTGQPLVASTGLALGAVTRTAGVIGDALVCARITSLHMCPERRGTARADVPEYAPLLLGKRMSPRGEEFLLVLTKDIGDFKPMLHQC